MIARQAATLLISIVFLTPAAVRAQQERIAFRHLTIADGLSQNAVRSIVQDPRGFEITAIGPALDRAVESGQMTTWSWSRHEFGGEYRRLLIAHGPDAKSLLSGIDNVTEELSAQESEAFQEFNSVCSSHQDNLWTILVAKP